jgi:hypothetical protein
MPRHHRWLRSPTSWALGAGLLLAFKNLPHLGHHLVGKDDARGAYGQPTNTQGLGGPGIASVAEAVRSGRCVERAPGIGPVAHPVGNELRIFLEVIPKERSEAVETFPRHRNREDPRAREELAELPCGLNALRDRKALMAGNFADRNSKIYRLERPFFALMQRLDVAGLPPHRGLSQ